MIAKAGLRVFIWSQTGYAPINTGSQVLIDKEELAAMISTILQEQLQLIFDVKPKRPWT